MPIQNGTRSARQTTRQKAEIPLKKDTAIGIGGRRNKDGPDTRSLAQARRAVRGDRERRFRDNSGRSVLTALSPSSRSVPCRVVSPLLSPSPASVPPPGRISARTTAAPAKDIRHR